MFIQTETQQDENLMKFLPGREVLSSGMVHFMDSTQAANSPLANRLFEVDGVESVILEQDSLTLGKKDEADWRFLKAPVLGVIMEHYMSGRPVIEEVAEASGDDQKMVGDDNAESRELAELINTRIRPAVQPGGGDIAYRGFEDGYVYLEFSGSANTFRSRIEAMLKHYVPEVSGIRDYLNTEARPGLASAEGIAVREVLEERINPQVAGHGGYISLVDVLENTAYIRLEGGCQGCGMADVTLKQGVEVEIRRAVPSIARVLDVTDHAGGTNPYYQPGKEGASAL